MRLLSKLPFLCVETCLIAAQVCGLGRAHSLDSKLNSPEILGAILGNAILGTPTVLGDTHRPLTHRPEAGEGLGAPLTRNDFS